MKDLKHAMQLLAVLVMCSMVWSTHAAVLSARDGDMSNTGIEVPEQAVTHAVKPLRSLMVKKPRSNQTAAKHAGFHGFYIDDAWVDLHTDYDDDGYFSEFSVFFDIDYDFGDAWVFADLYISRKGADWEHYHTTRSFYISAHSPNDRFEVFSELEQGVPGDYEVLIEVYEEGYDDIIASFESGYDDGMLPLPLEGRKYDVVVEEVIVIDSHDHGGSMNYLFIGLALLLGFGRKRRDGNKKMD